MTNKYMVYLHEIIIHNDYLYLNCNAVRNIIECKVKKFQVIILFKVVEKYIFSELCGNSNKNRISNLGCGEFKWIRPN